MTSAAMEKEKMSKKYINAETAILEIEKHIRTSDEIYLLQIHEKWLNDGLQLATDILYNQPAIDVIEVVRCKDCKHWDSDALCCSRENHYIVNAEINDYCSYGEQKNE